MGDPRPVGVDGADVQIIAQVQANPTASYAEIGRAVGLSGTSVGSRLERMREAGILTGLRALPIAGLFDRYPTLLSFEPQAAPEDLAQRMLKVGSVVWVDRQQDDRVTALVYSATQVCDALPPLVDVVGQEPELSLTLVERSVGPNDTLSPLDWRVMRELVEDPRASVTDLADRTGLAHNTVRKRRDKLWGEGYLRLFPLLQTAHAPGLIVFLMVLQAEDPDDRAKIQHVFPSGVPVSLHEDCGGRPGVTILGHASTVAELMDLEDRIEATEGLDLVLRIHNLARCFATERVLDWIDAEIETWEQARR